jgi:endonuclease/exonuclease/phosphatase family metal-dependent hydrolase
MLTLNKVEFESANQLKIGLGEQTLNGKMVQKLATTLANTANQLPTSFIIMGDFNGHSPLWGSKTTKDKCKNPEDFSPSRDCVPYPPDC